MGIESATKLGGSARWSPLDASSSPLKNTGEKKKFDPVKAKAEVDAIKAGMKKKSRAKYGGRFGDDNPHNNPNRRGKTTAKGLANAKKSPVKNTGDVTVTKKKRKDGSSYNAIGGKAFEKNPRKKGETGQQYYDRVTKKKR